MQLYMLNSTENDIYQAHIKYKMPKIVGIVTIISMINTTSERLKAIKIYFSAHTFSRAVQTSC